MASIQNKLFRDLPDAVTGHILTFLEKPESVAVISKAFARCVPIAHSQNYCNSYTNASFLGRFTRLFDDAPEVPHPTRLQTIRRRALQEISENRGLIPTEAWNAIAGATPLSKLSFNQIEQLGELIQARKDTDLIRFFDQIDLFQPKIAELNNQVPLSEPYQKLSAELAAKGLSNPEIGEELTRFTTTEKAKLFREYLASEEAKKLLTAAQLDLDHCDLTIFTPIEFTLLTGLQFGYVLLIIQVALEMRDLGLIKHCFRDPAFTQKLPISDDPFSNDNHPFLLYFLMSLRETNKQEETNFCREVFQIVRNWPEIQSIRFEHFEPSQLADLDNPKEVEMIWELRALRRAIRLNQFDW